MQLRTPLQRSTGITGFQPGFLLNLLLILILVIFPQWVFAEHPGFSTEELARLKRGEILLQTIRDEKPGAAARVTALLHTSNSEVWKILGYCKYEMIYVKGLKLCEMLDGDQYKMTVHHRLRNSWYAPTLDFVFSASRDSSGTGKATLVSGDLKVLEGQWTLYPMEGESGVIAVYEIRIQSRFPAPKWLIRRTLQNDLPDMMACIRGLAAASGTNRHIQRDLKRCPGDVAQLNK
jgi:hypothetical protein